MGTTTFSGPIRAGNIRNTVGTTLGSDVANVGYVVMMQTHTMDLSGGAIAAGATDMVIPANSKIIDVVVDLATAANATTNISVGDTVGGATTILNTLASWHNCWPEDCYYSRWWHERSGQTLVRLILN